MISPISRLRCADAQPGTVQTTEFTHEGEQIGQTSMLVLKCGAAARIAVELESTTPVKPTPSRKATEVLTASWPTIASSDEQGFVAHGIANIARLFHHFFVDAGAARPYRPRRRRKSSLSRAKSTSVPPQPDHPPLPVRAPTHQPRPARPPPATAAPRLVAANQRQPTRPMAVFAQPAAEADRRAWSYPP